MPIVAAARRFFTLLVSIAGATAIMCRLEREAAVSAPTRQSRCRGTRAWAALAPDGELSQLERRLLDAHLARCSCCRYFAEQVETIAEELRAAALERSPTVSEGERPSVPRGSAQAEVDEAELQTMRQLRREAVLSRASYSDRPSRAFGTQPA